MAYKHYVDQVAPSSGRTYTINGTTGGTIVDTTQYEVVGSDFGAQDIMDVGVLEANYARNGTVHQLSTENTSSIQMRFSPTASYNAGDTFTVNGTAFTVKSTMGAVTLPTNFFTNGSIVVFLVDWTNHILYVPVDPMSYVLGQTNASNLSTLQNSFNTVQTKVNGIEAGAQVNKVTGVKGDNESNYRTGQISLSPANIGAVPTSRTINSKALSANITISKSDLSLGNVDNVKQMPIAGGTFTGNAIAYSSNRNTSGGTIRNIVFVTSGYNPTSNLISSNSLVGATS